MYMYIYILKYITYILYINNTYKSELDTLLGTRKIQWFSRAFPPTWDRMGIVLYERRMGAVEPQALDRLPFLCPPATWRDGFGA